jgi:hypothetical protein
VTTDDRIRDRTITNELRDGIDHHAITGFLNVRRRSVVRQIGEKDGVSRLYPLGDAAEVIAGAEQPVEQYDRPAAAERSIGKIHQDNLGR